MKHLKNKKITIIATVIFVALPVLFSLIQCTDKPNNSIESVDIVGKWQGNFPYIPAEGMKPLNIEFNLIFSPESTYQFGTYLVIDSATSKPLFLHNGTWHIVADSVYLQGLNCKKVQSLILTDLSEYPCGGSIAIYININKNNTLWTVNFKDFEDAAMAIGIDIKEVTQGKDVFIQLKRIS